MGRFPRFLCWLMALLWMPITQHCGLEAAAGLLESHAPADQSCCPGGEEHCSHDGCEVIEGGGYKIDDGTPRLVAPQLVVCLCLIYQSVVVPPLEDATTIWSAQDFERPLDWVPAWQFVQRAALSPRAPSLALA
ncbi:MAG: hypothetical protein ACREH8_07670 [Opitutaceae bacterium]